MSKKHKKNVDSSVDSNIAKPQGNNAFLNQMKQNIQRKMKTDQRKDVDLEEIKRKELSEQLEAKKAKEEHKKGVKIKKAFDKETRKEALDWKDTLKRTVLAGVAAASSVVPGSQTTLFIGRTNHMYDKLCKNVTTFFKPKSIVDWLWTLLWLVPFFAIFLLVFCLTYFIYFKIQEQGYGISMMFLFIGLSFFSAPLIFYMSSSRVKFAFTKKQFDEELDKDKKPGVVWGMFLGGFLLIIGIAFVARFAWKTDSFPIDTPILKNIPNLQGVVFPNYNIDNYVYNNNDSISTSYAFQILFASFLCGIFMLIPGVSGTYMLGVVGSNGDINAAIAYGFNGWKADPSMIMNENWAWSTIIISFIGCFCGIVSSAFFIKYMKRVFNDGYRGLVLGMYAASIIALFIAISKENYAVLGQNKNVLGCSLGLLFTSMIPSFIWIIVWQRLGLVNIKWLSFVGQSKLRSKINHC